jgi:hypothetical protein
MPINLSINEPLARNMLKLIDEQLPIAKEKIEAATKEYDELLYAKAELEKSLNSVSTNGKPSSSEREHFPFNKKWVTLKKVLYILYTVGRPMATSEIVDTILSNLEPEETPNRAKWIGNVSSVAGTSAKKNKLKRGTNVLGEYVYGLPDNFNAQMEFAGTSLNGFNFI